MKDHSFRQHFGQNTQAGLPEDGKWKNSEKRQIEWSLYQKLIDENVLPAL